MISGHEPERAFVLTCAVILGELLKLIYIAGNCLTADRTFHCAGLVHEVMVQVLYRSKAGLLIYCLDSPTGLAFGMQFLMALVKLGWEVQGLGFFVSLKQAHLSDFRVPTV